MSEVSTITQETENIHQAQLGKPPLASKLDKVLFEQLKAHTQEIMNRCE